MSEATDPKAKQEFMTMIGHSLEILEVDDGMLSKTNRQSIRNGILETISELMYQRDAANARAEAAEARAAELQAALTAAINMNIEKNAEVARLTAELAAANEDAERLAAKHTERDRAWGETCIYCHEQDGFMGIDTIKHAADCPITLHRARVGGAS